MTRLSNTHPALRSCWLPAARSAEIGSNPVAATIAGVPIVLIRPQPDAPVRAFLDRCPHRGAPLSLGTGEAGGIRCGYHGWRFDEEGRCDEIPALGDARASIPSRARLIPVATTAETLGLVFLTLDSPLPGAALPALDEADDPRFLMGELPVISCRASAGLLADNFLDTAHFPFVHAASFGAGEERVVGRFEVDRHDGELGFTARYEHLFANREDPGVPAGLRPLVQTRRLTYRLVAPFHLTLRIDFVEAGGTNSIGFFIQPETDERCRIYSAIWRDDLDGDTGRLQEAVDFELKVVEEDLRIQEGYADLSIPTDLASPDELHTKADRTTLELRRVLAELVRASDAATVSINNAASGAEHHAATAAEKEDVRP